MTKPQHLRAFVLGIIGVLLAWQVLARSLVAYLAHHQPEAALKLRADDPQALLRLAEEHLDVLQASEASKPSPISEPAPRIDGTSERLRIWSELAKAVDRSKRTNGGEAQPVSTVAASGATSAPMTREGLRAAVELVLSRDPLNARALRILGQIADTVGEEPRAASLMQAAADTSIRESVAVYWLMHKSYEKQDFDKALFYADALLRTRSQIMPHVLPILVRIAENPQAKSGLEKLLADNPPWRRAFLSALPHAVSDARTPLGVLLAIRNSPTPPAAEDIRDYLNFLIEHKFFELAYYTWLQFLPPEQLNSAGLLFNGNFESDPSGLPFDWVFSPGNGVTMDIVQQEDQAQRALLIEMGPGRVEFGGVTQLTLLAPGTYRFKGKHRGEIIGRRGLVWRVTCAGATGAPLGESAMINGIAPHWREDGFSLTVPERDCRAQRLRLELDARMASEQLVNGSVWFDELQISRVN